MWAFNIGDLKHDCSVVCGDVTLRLDLVDDFLSTCFASVSITTNKLSQDYTPQGDGASQNYDMTPEFIKPLTRARSNDLFGILDLLDWNEPYTVSKQFILYPSLEPV